MFVPLDPVLDGRPHHQLLFPGETVGADTAAPLAKSLQGAGTEMTAQLLGGGVDALEVHLVVFGVVVYGRVEKKERL